VTPIFDRALVDHLIETSFQMPPEVDPVPQPTRFDAELVVAGIEGRAIVRSARWPSWVQR
jgi:hypothetical protein